MATIAENLQTIKNSTDAIKQAIIDKGGTVSGDITTWADSISDINGGDLPNNIVLSQTDNEDNDKIFKFLEGLVVNGTPVINAEAGRTCYIQISNTDGVEASDIVFAFENIQGVSLQRGGSCILH